MLSTSEIPKTTSSGSIQFHGTYSTEALEKEKNGDSSNRRTSSRSQSRASTRASHVSSAASSAGQVRYVENWLNQKSLRRLQDKHSIEDFESRQLYSTVLRNEENFVHGIDEFLRENDLLNLRRKELLHKEWHENVYTPTRKKIEATFEEGYMLLNQRKRAEYLKYLEYKNKKGDVFLDVISKEEYDPLCLLQKGSQTKLQARTGRLHDPLLAQERQRIDEQRTIHRCQTGEVLTDDEIQKSWLPPMPLRPLGRHGTTCTTWKEMPLTLIESPIHDRSRKRMIGSLYISNIALKDLPNHVATDDSPPVEEEPNSEALSETQEESTNEKMTEQDEPALPPSNDDPKIEEPPQESSQPETKDKESVEA